MYVEGRGSDVRLRVASVFCNLVELEGFEGAGYDVGLPNISKFSPTAGTIPFVTLTKTFKLVYKRSLFVNSIQGMPFRFKPMKKNEKSRIRFCTQHAGNAINNDLI